MERSRTSFGPLIVAIVLLVVIAAYVGSYLYLVTPYGSAAIVYDSPSNTQRVVLYHYRVSSEWIPIAYWPLEQLDRRNGDEKYSIEASLSDSWHGEVAND